MGVCQSFLEPDVQEDPDAEQQVDDPRKERDKGDTDYFNGGRRPSMSIHFNNKVI